ncbi:helix-turn-helix domain-containing protein [Planctomycetes bacterium Pan216]|uniref:helix-turn-helix domain-containing protein n=1 Tax=Kolteria novifilia TaxID=2527975 RepID=UPI0011A6DA56
MMQEYNRRCKPPWSDSELLRKLNEADQFDSPRGRLRRGNDDVSNFAATVEPLAGAEFHGYVPDFAHAGGLDVLGHVNSSFFTNALAGAKYYFVWRLQRSDAHVPDVWIRQCVWGGNWPKNWRARLYRQFRKAPPTARPMRCTLGRDLCPLSGTSVLHQHFDDIGINKWGVLEGFRAPLDEVSLTLGSDDDFDEEDLEGLCDMDDELPSRRFLWRDRKNAEIYQQSRKDQLIVVAYCPALLFGGSKHIAWSEAQQRLLQGIVYELTRPSSRESREHVITDALVNEAGARDDLVRCPLLDRQQRYVVFGGNGSRPGRGYQIVGRTSKGWLHRAGVRHSIPKGSPTRFDAIKNFLDDLDVLSTDLDLTVVGYHSTRNEWKDLPELRSCLRRGFGRDWLDECVIRIYAPEDWRLRWRYFFSKRLGFRWIPESASDKGPFMKAEQETTADIGAADVKQWLREIGWTQKDLADAIGCSLKRVVRHLSGERTTTGFYDDVSVIMSELNET